MANYMVEASVPTITHFGVVRKDVRNLYKRLMFRPKGLHLHAKSGSDKGLWAEMSAIYINYKHLCGLH